MRRHIGVVSGAAIAVVGLFLAVAAFGGFSVGLPAIRPASALGASWFMIAVILIFAGTFVALAARGLQIDAAEHRPVDVRTSTRPVRRLHAVR